MKALIRTAQAYRSFNTKQLFQKILITFAGTTALMQLQKTLLPFVLAERLLKTSLTGQTGKNSRDLSSKFRVLHDDLFFENLQEVSRLRKSSLAIENYVIGKRIRQKALIGRMTKKTDKIIRL